MELNLPPALAGFCPDFVILLDELNGLPEKLFPLESVLKPLRYPPNELELLEFDLKLLPSLLTRRQHSAYKCFANFRFPQHRGFRQKSLKLAMAALASEGAANRP
jgi:hypothetical protein